MSESIYDFTVQSIKGADVGLDQYRGKTLLIVNTASKCGFTGQYAGLEELWQKYNSKGLVILGFPCNQFAGQEPGSNAEIASFCQLQYNVSFPLFSKIEVNGKNTHPLYVFLKTKCPGILGKSIKWNFTKFLVDSTGNPVKRFASTVTPAQLEDELALHLK
jgi:glutathione peroxidase